jgi:hypothetical protein
MCLTLALAPVSAFSYPYPQKSARSFLRNENMEAKQEPIYYKEKKESHGGQSFLRNERAKGTMRRLINLAARTTR